MSPFSLAKAMRLGPHPCLAMVGAGGKTTALFRLARQLPGPVLVTATTHLAYSQLSLADRHQFIYRPEELDSFAEQLPAGVTLLTGPAGEDERVSGIGDASLGRLQALANAHRAPLLIEADGSRRLPVKAPAGHEPAIPQFVRQVVVVAGLSALGKPLDPTWVHRPERFAALSGLAPGSPIDPAGLQRVLTHPDGGIKNIPVEARSIALLNQADTPSLQAQAGEMAGSLLEAFAAVVIASLLQPEGKEVWRVSERKAAIVLAAGASARLGQPKQLLSWDGEPFVRRVAQVALEAGLDPVIVVTGASAPEVEAALAGLPVVVARNPHWPEGQSTSIQTGLRALPVETGACLFLLSDQPQVPVELVRKMVEVHETCLAPLVAPRVAGRRANPVLFDRVTFRALAELTGDVGGRPLFSDPYNFPVAWVPWDDPALLLDVDTAEAYAELLRAYGKS